MYTVNEYYKDRFGCKVYKLALDGGMGCPNRDGKVGTGGCIFCSDAGSGEFAEPRCESVDTQIARAKKRVEIKAQHAKYIPYFQSYTNTYAPVSYLENLFSEAMAGEDIAGLAIATRPDCLPDTVLDLLCRLNGDKPVFIELGLQTIHEKTAAYIRRGYPTAVYDRAVKALVRRNIETVAHVILGLPGENRDDMKETVRHVAKSGAAGIKFHLLHVLAGTDLEKDYRADRFSVLSLPEYCDILCDCIALLPKGMVIHRLTGDGDKRRLVAPLWSGDKKRVLNTIYKEVRLRGL